MMATSISLLAMLFFSSWSSMVLLIPFLMVYMSLHLFSPMSTPMTLSYLLTLDTMSTTLIMLTLWITNLMIITSMKIKHRHANPKLFMWSVTLLCIILIMSFTVANLWAFYILFEASLIPTLVIILTWGYQPERIQAGVYLIMYTVTASLPLLMMVMKLTGELVNQASDEYGEIIFLEHDPYPFPHPWENYHVMLFGNQPHFKYLMFFLKPSYYACTEPIHSFALLFSFLVKMPMYLTHLWLPKAHVEAPAAGSMVLAGILLKLGGYGMMRVLTIFPMAANKMAPLTIPISCIGAILTSILCIRQTDMKSMIAFSSVGHMAFVVTGIFTMNKWGWEGSVMMMIAHGLVSSGLFAAANMYYENSLSRNLLINSGMMKISPTMTLWWFLLIAGNMAAPPFINLLSEIILITSAMMYSAVAPLCLALTSFFTVCYSMILYTSLHHGPVMKSTNFFNAPPIYFTISALHVGPALLLVMSSSQLSCWA